MGRRGRRQKEPLRPLTAEERGALERVSRAGSERADRVARARMLLAVAAGARLVDAARASGRRSRHAVAHLVARFNAVGLAALDRPHGGGPAIRYGAVERERILAEFRRAPDRERDGTATWSLSTLQQALRTAPDGLPQVTTRTILLVLWDAGYSWQANRTWCHTGTVVRKRKTGSVEVTDPDTTQKKT
jgi:transposase